MPVIRLGLGLWLFGLLGVMSCATRQTPNYVYEPPVLVTEASAPAPEFAPKEKKSFFGRKRAAKPAADESVLESPATVELEPEVAPPEKKGWFSFFGRKKSESADADASVGEVADAKTDPLEEAPEQGEKKRRFSLFGWGADEPAAIETAPVAEAPELSAFLMRPNDPVVIHLRGIPEPVNFELIIDETGHVNLPYIDSIMAAGKTASQLQTAIEKAYLDGEIYRRITVNVMLPTQSYFVRGEVRQPGRFALMGGMTILKAVATAGGYTEFANPRRVSVIRRGETFESDLRDFERNPERDIDVEPGDVIVVPRSMF